MKFLNPSELFKQQHDTVEYYNGFKIIGPVRLPVKLSNESRLEIQAFLFSSQTEQFLVCTFGNLSTSREILFRASSACVFGFILNSLLCDCRDQFEEAIEKMQNANAGILIYCLDQHGKGIGLDAHFLIYAEGQRQNKGLFSEIYTDLGLAVDYREYEETAKIVEFFSTKYPFTDICVLTEAPDKINYFTEKFQNIGLKVKIGSFSTELTPENAAELAEKRELGYQILSAQTHACSVNKIDEATCLEA